MRAARSTLATGLLLSMALTACRTDHRTTWADDHAEGVPSNLWPVRPEAPRPAPSRPGPDLAAARLDPDALAHHLEVTLLRFTARRRALSAEAPARAGWPVALVRAWQGVLTELERGLSADGVVLPSRLLVQARVTVEAELELSERRHGRAPEALATRVTGVYVGVARQMRAQRGRPRVRARPSGDLVFVWPVAPVVVTSPFGFRRDPILGEDRVRFHAGVDLGGRRGDVVVAAGPGKVIGAGWLGGHGRTVTVQHVGGYVTRYAHLSRILVPMHGEVDAGSPIGLVGSSGRSTGPHLHFEVRRGSVPIDPLELVGVFGGPYANR